jgi:hypothetical protein
MTLPLLAGYFTSVAPRVRVAWLGVVAEFGGDHDAMAWISSIYGCWDAIAGIDWHGSGALGCDSYNRGNAELAI